MHFPCYDTWLEGLLTDDCPGLDLTVEMLGIAAAPGIMRFAPKADCIISGVEEAQLLLRKCGLAVSRTAGNGDRLKAGQQCLEARGSAAALHRGWKIAQTLMEYMTGIASRAAHMVEQAHAVNPGVRVAVTRKNFPGAKALCLEAAMNGGAMVHRQNLSDSILVFAQHRVFLPGEAQLSLRNLAAMMDKLRLKAPERKISAEVDDEANVVSKTMLDETNAAQRMMLTAGAVGLALGVLGAQFPEFQHVDRVKNAGHDRQHQKNQGKIHYRSSQLSTRRTARKASCGISTLPTCFMRFLPAFCFSSSFFLRDISPP